MSLYILDTSVFIEAHRTNYPFDVFASFWNKLLNLSQEKRIASIGKVWDEIHGSGDALEEWCSSMPHNFFLDETTAISSYGQIITFAQQCGRYSQIAIEEFSKADNADAFLIAYCKAHSDRTVLVSQEVTNNFGKKRSRYPISAPWMMWLFPA